MPLLNNWFGRGPPASDGVEATPATAGVAFPDDDLPEDDESPGYHDDPEAGRAAWQAVREARRARTERKPKSAAAVQKRQRKPLVHFKPARPPYFGDGAMITRIKVYLNIFEYTVEVPGKPRPRIFQVRPEPPWIRPQPVTAQLDPPALGPRYLGLKTPRKRSWEEEDPWETQFWETVKPKPLKEAASASTLVFTATRTTGSGKRSVGTSDKAKNLLASFKPTLDILYLDREFWETWGRNTTADADHLLPRISKEESAGIENIALDVLTLKHERTCGKVMEEIRRYFPSLKNIWAFVTTLADRPKQVRGPAFARLEDDIQRRVFVEDQRRAGIRNPDPAGVQDLEHGRVWTNVEGCRRVGEQWKFAIKLLVLYKDPGNKKQAKVADRDMIMLYKGLEDGRFR